MATNRNLFAFMLILASAALAFALLSPRPGDVPGPGEADVHGSGERSLETSAPAPGAGPSSVARCMLDAGKLARDPLILDSFPAITDPIAAARKLPGDAFNANAVEGVHATIVRAMEAGCKDDRVLIDRLYDIFAWRVFLHLNGAGGTGGPSWLAWKQERDIMREDGERPAPWGAPRLLPSSFPHPMPGDDVRVLWEITQPLSERLTQRYRAKDLVLRDQNRNPVYYEILVNRDVFDHIQDEDLHDLDTLLEKTRRCPDPEKCRVVFGPSALTSDGPSPPATGPIELKLAWKILDGTDIAERFYRRTAWVSNGRGAWQKRQVGLVAMHIARKTLSSSRWVWTTFEHVDNVEVDETDVARHAGQNRVLRPSFHDPDCAECVVNTPMRSGEQPTQVQRINPIPPGAEALNAQVRRALASRRSVWQHYQLIGTQYFDGDKPSVTNLANAVIETYDQHDMEYRYSCMGCHEQAGLPRKNPDGKTARFPATADFSFLFEGLMYRR